jgi:glycosyltransferase involved in cell wall biosynthesis
VRHVLFLAYHFPPTGGAGVQRSAKFARFLPDHGYEPVVVTGPGPQPEDPWTPSDDSLRDELAEELTVLRIASRRPPLSARGRARLERWARLSSPFARWWVDGAVEAARSAPEVELVYASLSPYESAEAAAAIAAERGVPWVADLRDPWALDEMRVEPSRLHLAAERRRMRVALSSASAIIMNTPEAAARLAKTFPSLSSKLSGAIPNGYDPDDFEVAPEARDDSAFRIVHTGYLHTELGGRQRRHALLHRALGGSSRGLDILTRSHVFLLEALERLGREQPDLPIELHLAGLASGADRAAGSLAGGVRFRGYLPHRETIALMRSADLLFLPMQNLPAGTRATIVPGKTYEYLGSRRPMLAAVPDGDARDLLAGAAQARLCRPPDVDAMVRIVRDLALRRRDHGPEPDAPDDPARPFDRQRLTGDLAAVFTNVLEPGRGERQTVSLSA